ncbi:MAG TPA: hypothetical protein VKJ47_02265, partial [Candidatus Binatia bacterium]|nr:hypothetical protein [Candidatus Binatia bacterium]
LRVLQLPEEIKEEVDRGNLSVDHARTLLALETPEQQLELARKIIRQGLSVRETETLMARAPEHFPADAAPRPPAGEPPARPDLFVSALEEELMRALGTKVRLRPRKKGGRIEIEYYSNEELEGLVRRLKG